MQTTVKLYSLEYSDVKTYLATSLFVLGNIALPQIFHLIPQGGNNLAADLFLYACRGIQVRMEGRAADSRLVSDSQFASVRYAYVGITSVYPAEIRPARSLRGVGGGTF